MPKKMRIAKFIANAGFCSRRDAEKLIEVPEDAKKVVEKKSNKAKEK